MSEQDVYISGSWRAGRGAPFENLCPATGEIAWQGHAADADQVRDAAASARSALQDWSHRPQAERTSILEAYATALTDRKSKIAAAISYDMGKVGWEAAAEAGAMIGKVALSINAQVERAGDRTTEAAFGALTLTHRPHGVMAVFGPFNFPGHLPNGHIVPALLAGNTCVFKPSELAPSVAAIMVEAFEEAGLPDGCLNIVHGGRETGGALLDADINGLLFTGSYATGRYFHQHFAGRPEVILALEMGGNNPLIAWDVEDLDAAADIAAQSAFLTTGQRCSCARRLIVADTDFGTRLIEAIRQRADGLKIGAWTEDGMFMGPLVSERAAEQAVDFQADLLDRGASAVKPLERLPADHGFVSPGLIDVTNANNVPDEELFGPLLQIVRVPTFEDAIARANATQYGLAAGLISDNDALWAAASTHLRAGILNRNRPTAGASGALPFGGPGASGNYRPGAYYAADYCAWPQAGQVAPTAQRLTAQGFPG